MNALELARTAWANRPVAVRAEALAAIVDASRPPLPIIRAGEVLYEFLPDLGQYRISGTFGQVYRIPGRAPYAHRGVDVATPIGVPLVAPGPGVVTVAGDQRSFGLAVTIDHEMGIVARYTIIAHMSRVDVRKGQRVYAGTPIGLSGVTGDVTGPHYHVQRSGYDWWPIDINLNADPLQFMATQEEIMEVYRLELFRIAGGQFRPMVNAYTRLDAKGFFAELNKAEGVAAPIDGDNDLNDSIVRRFRIQWLASGPRAREAWEAL